MQLKSLALLGVEGYAVLLNVSNSDCRVLCGSDIAQEYIEAEEEKGHAVDDMFFKYMCGKTVIPSLIIEMDLLLATIIIFRSELHEKKKEK